MSKSLIPIEVIAGDICSDIQDSTGKYKFKITRYLIDGYNQLHLYVDQEFSVKTAVLSYDNVVVLPSDFIYETKVGVLHRGCLAVLTLDKTVEARPLNDTQCCNYLNSVWDNTYEGDGYYFYNAFRGGESLGELYGYGRGVKNNGCYNINRKDGEIYIGSHIPNGAEIVVEYKSSGSDNGLKLVPSEMKLALYFWGKFMYYADKNVTQSQINQNLYEIQKYKLKSLYNFRSALYMSSKINESFSPTNY